MSNAARYHVRHETVYTYGSDVVHSRQLLHLVPRPAAYQQCLEHEIHISPGTFRRTEELDAFGNPVTRVEVDRPHRKLEVTTDMEVEVYPRPAIPAADTIPWDELIARFNHTGEPPARTDLEAVRFRHESPYVRVKGMFTDYAEDCFPAGRPLLVCALELMTKLHTELKYAPGATTIATPVTEVLEIRRGVCQDFAHLMIACLRSRGLPARYVSGYVRSLVGSAASHAWVAVYIPPFDWVELDPTNDTLISTDHIAVAWGRDFGDVSPLRGIILGGGHHSLVVDVNVARISSGRPS
ncbi:MAG TPA: transglutaminase family protein [Steroidobacteraceae bacterium]